MKVTLLFVLLSSATLGFTCPTNPITTATLTGNLSFGATNVPPGTNCTFMFNIPNYYVLLINIFATAGYKEDTVTIFDSNNDPIFVSSDNPMPDLHFPPIWIPAGSAKIQVIGVSGHSQFLATYTYKSLDNYQQIRTWTGEHFSLKSIVDNTYVTITSSSPEEKVILTPGMKQGEIDNTLQNYFVYDGDNINTARFLGRLSEFKSSMKKSTGQSVSIILFSDTKSNSYVLGNDASTLQQFEKYSVILTSKGSEMHGVMNDIRKSAYTFICTDCSTYSWTQLALDFVGNIQYGGHITLQKLTPTHRKKKLAKYDMMTFTNQYFTEILPTEVFTINLHLAKAEYNVYSTQDDNESRNLISGRSSPNLYTANSKDNIGDILKYQNSTASDHRSATFAGTGIRLSFEIQKPPLQNRRHNYCTVEDFCGFEEGTPMDLKIPSFVPSADSSCHTGITSEAPLVALNSSTSAQSTSCRPPVSWN
ncbi:hypothetical protein GCK72_020530 [Caenorhabditis remanei]|uniref:CUB-like domain-containing protein n=1 Tax=Caenorhabditis remanei TaxID=31234 RepID=A0A6A5GH08_CAERE|nr:hypothetical protein GCK72_020530 [Caenorhabditis remanei]KAF1753973.1 hypothetical protein GCK72_020530 [Caenorhabditis remanei]